MKNWGVVRMLNRDDNVARGAGVGCRAGPDFVSHVEFTTPGLVLLMHLLEREKPYCAPAAIKRICIEQPRRSLAAA